jgi:hypothetical protein
MRKPTIKQTNQRPTPTSKPSSAKQPVNHQPIKPTALPASLAAPKQSLAQTVLPEREKKE